MMELSFHPIADIFPLLGEAEIAALAADIRENGLQTPILLHPEDGSIIDGRNRYIACQRTGIYPTTRTWDGIGSLTALVWSLNGERRHLTSSQKAAIAVELLPMLEAEARERQATSTGGLTPQLRAKLPEADKGRAREHAAALTGTSARYVSDAKQLKEQAPELFDEVKAGAKSLPEAKREAMAVHYSSDSEEWYTPPEIVTRVIETLGEIDLDPCSDAGANVPAGARFVRDDDGLQRDWFGRVYMNPPYGRSIVGWVEKLCAEYASGRVKEAIALVPARVDTDWFRLFRDQAICFIDGRLKFSGHQNSAPFPSAVVYVGPDIPTFNKNFASIGDVWERYGK